MEEKVIGKIVHYFAHVSVGVIELSDALRVGDKIHIKGAHDDVVQEVASMQIEHADVTEAKAGDHVGIKVAQKVHQHDLVYKVV
ncbi:MAG: translation elongation factor-like protein [Candidatus Omnitrophica bacterium]|nr:translation elongation factor-like protein [Candidatus Omnitrophota bacterium]